MIELSPGWATFLVGLFTFLGVLLTLLVQQRSRKLAFTEHHWKTRLDVYLELVTQLSKLLDILVDLQLESSSAKWNEFTKVNNSIEMLRMKALLLADDKLGELLMGFPAKLADHVKSCDDDSFDIYQQHCDLILNAAREEIGSKEIHPSTPFYKRTSYAKPS